MDYLGRIVLPKISTHSAREDGDHPLYRYFRWNRRFQPTPPARTETMRRLFCLAVWQISTHSAREDGDLGSAVLEVSVSISTHSAREDGD